MTCVRYGSRAPHLVSRVARDKQNCADRIIPAGVPPRRKAPGGQQWKQVVFPSALVGVVLVAVLDVDAAGLVIVPIPRTRCGAALSSESRPCSWASLPQKNFQFHCERRGQKQFKYRGFPLDPYKGVPSADECFTSAIEKNTRDAARIWCTFKYDCSISEEPMAVLFFALRAIWKSQFLLAWADCGWHCRAQRK